ncbi:MAG: aminoglycoside phosphotransferase family protein [Bacteroidales bacterium]|nr:aminoglycoside phosphotransferase family protein [Bacteroidales bacterium]
MTAEDMDVLKLNRIAGEFFPGKAVSSIVPFGEGHINDTYKLGLGGTGEAFILQRINTKVFSNPRGVANTHLKIQEVLSGQTHPLEIARLIPDRSGDPVLFDKDGNAWRMTSFIDNSVTIEVVKEPWQAFEAGRGFGWFNKICHSLDVTRFPEPIKDFHRLSFRIRQLDEAINRDAAKRLITVLDLVKFYKDREQSLSLIEEMTDQGKIPLQVVHNDTKINNLLFRGRKAAAVIDLDTVGPGIIHYDYGDALRTGGNTSNEDEQDLENVDFNMQAFEAFTRGYMEQVCNIITKAELDNLHLAPRLMAFIMGIRFLADYLNGDVYYKTAYPGHNLDRSRVQMKLMECMEAREAQMKATIDNAFAALSEGRNTSND